MPRIIIMIGILLLAGASLFAENLRMGIIGAFELAGDTDCDEYFDHICDSPVIFPGIYWEVIMNHTGFGMTYMGKFKKTDNAHPSPGEPEREWNFDWIGSFDMRYHFMPESFFDPFLEFGIGCAGRVYLTYIDEHGTHYTPAEPLELSIFFQAGGGITFRFDYLEAGLKLDYRLMNEPVPATWYPVYDLQKIQSSVFIGVSF